MAVIMRARSAAPSLLSGAAIASAARTAGGMPVAVGSTAPGSRPAEDGPPAFSGVSGFVWTTSPGCGLSWASGRTLVLGMAEIALIGLYYASGINGQ